MSPSKSSKGLKLKTNTSGPRSATRTCLSSSIIVTHCVGLETKPYVLSRFMQSSSNSSSSVYLRCPSSAKFHCLRQYL